MKGLFRPPKTQHTQEFYSKVVNNEQHKNHIWGKDQRFNSEKAIKSTSVKKYFTNKIVPLIGATDRVLDLGCGSGMFLPVVSPLCRELTGVDVSPAFVEESLDTVEKFALNNTSIIAAKSEDLPFAENEFDVVIVVDVLHHIYYLSETVSEIQRITKPGGRIIVFEPNILNPALFIMCLLDRNEWGALGLGHKQAYRELFRNIFKIDCIDYNGLLIGPDSSFSLKIADWLNKKSVSKFLGWLNPKIFISMTNLK